MGWARTGKIGIDWGVQLAVQKRLGCGYPIRGLSMGNRWLLVGEIGERLGGSLGAVYACLSGRGQHGHKVGRLWEFKRAEGDGTIVKSHTEGRP